VFTWGLLDALKNGDRTEDGYIELSQLVAHMQDQVPRNAAEAWPSRSCRARNNR
jgi:hypothetical protein